MLEVFRKQLISKMAFPRTQTKSNSKWTLLNGNAELQQISI